METYQNMTELEKLESYIQIGVIYLRQKRFYRAQKQFQFCVEQARRTRFMEKKPGDRERAEDLLDKCGQVFVALDNEGEDIDVEKLLIEIRESFDIGMPEDPERSQVLRKPGE